MAYTLIYKRTLERVFVKDGLKGNGITDVHFDSETNVHSIEFETDEHELMFKLHYNDEMIIDAYFNEISRLFRDTKMIGYEISPESLKALLGEFDDE